MKAGATEYWVLRVICEAVAPGEKLATISTVDRLAALWGVARGRYQVVGNDICEPIECFDEDEQAKAVDRARREHQRTGHVHKVTMVIRTEDR